MQFIAYITTYEIEIMVSCQLKKKTSSLIVAADDECMVLMPCAAHSLKTTAADKTHMVLIGCGYLIMKDGANQN